MALGVLLDGKEEIQVQLKVTRNPDEFIETDYADWEASHKPLNMEPSHTLYSAINPDQYTYQWREIGEGDWVDSEDPDWILYCEQSPEHDTRVIKK
ncbi:hypothetical protein [Pseudoalteromonas sp. T1lg22]|uniref:hypothetical protein n=1 Tax=Pseudoalteromonas sp. T1lg22 TaxID=2077096 RepID=UPI0018F88877|nr:hypothetical protein [Pseudoalteromonas sp. T1lg22]